MPVDFDGLFFNLSDDSTIDNINFSPEANDGSIFSPVTGIQAAANAIDTLQNGAQVADGYDIGIQFGTTASTTQGEVANANFTLFSANGQPLSISDLDISSFAAVVNSDDGVSGQVLTTGDTPDADPVLVSKEVLFDNFNDIHVAEDSSIVEGHTNWAAAWDKLVTNSNNEGVLNLQTVSTDGPVTLSFDANVHNTHLFENSGAMADSLRVEVSIDGGPWVLLDEFAVNDAGTALVGSLTGQTFGNSAGNVLYEGGILDTAQDTVQFRFDSDVTAADEFIKLDNISVTASEEVDGAVQSVETVLLSEDFNAIDDPDNSTAIEYDGRWDVRGDQLVTDGYNDGVLKTAAVAADGDVTLSFDARVEDASLFEASGYYADHLTLQVRTEDGNWQTLDKFVVNNAGTALVGSNTGNEITESGGTLSYSGGALDDINGNVQFRIISDISSSNERVFFDNLTVTETTTEVVADGEAITLDFEGLSSGDVVDGQFEGVTVSAQRAGDGEASQNDAMIFDTNSPTGGDYDLGYSDRGNALIISEDNDSSDADDNARGGTISFDFDAPSEVVSIKLLDIEEHGGTIDLFDVDGTLINTVDIPASGNNSQQEVIINADNVSTMNVNLVGSGAVDDLTFIPTSDEEFVDDGKGDQYDVQYIAGIPVLQPVSNDKLVEAIEAIDAVDDVEEDDIFI
ncbi:hypothetical protein [Sulfitobacter guttiformis]|uniref:Uncharacterized protein n=1 Tax=Sulfitobacter guttiformis TaxID=74349 RepID=A0A420DNE7_9RHOB|nr:hypothetical protein [Sulfitobacter guttiformis]KIN73131.1 Cna protein B-type domain [Sulfitobacter guttiformis KCTC 32187]RKE95814.1 hypothetical protein C8N30_0355 [Sulfitobacter guttiformis]